MPLPVVYRKSGDVMINFDFADLLTSTGYVKLYGIDDDDGNYKLTRLPLCSKTALTDLTGLNPAASTLNFDYEFLIPANVKGEMWVSAIYSAYVNTGSCDAHIDCEIFHYDGTTETSIGTLVTTDVIQSTGPTRSCLRTPMKFDVNKKFNKGDILRVKIKLYVQYGNSNSNCRLYHDGINRDFSQTSQGKSVPSTLEVDVPFEVDL